MLIFEKSNLLQNFLQPEKNKGKKIGLVPTMGALHTGHLSLIEKSIEENDFTVCSIFVNPTQFNNIQDLAKYPRTLEADIALLEKYENLCVFCPSEIEIYPTNPTLRFDFGELENIMEGKFRPTHFNGVAIVVSKLFHIVQPQKAYFGQKDLQQCVIIRQLVYDLSFPLELVICPTIRELDGLAMSSRNKRLNPHQRQIATKTPQALFMARELLLQNPQELDKAKNKVEEFLANTEVKLEYFEIVTLDTLQILDAWDTSLPIALCIAVWIDDIRLLDNVIL